jgi:antitoxin (DNA-binding transcriptional repressor) of toxin-antitoxin stability system
VLSMSPVRAQNPASRVDDDDDALVFTMRDLNQWTARIMSEVEKTGKPAFITRHGRFVAMITPLAPGQVESRVLAEMAREIVNRAQGEPDASVTAPPYWSPALPTGR